MGIIQTQIEPLHHLLLLPCYTIDRHGKLFFFLPRLVSVRSMEFCCAKISFTLLHRYKAKSYSMVELPKYLLH